MPLDQTPGAPIPTSFQHPRHVALYFPVSRRKLAGAIDVQPWDDTLYWFYCNWDFERVHNRRRVSPIWRSLLAPFGSYALFRRIKNFGARESVPLTYSPGLLALAFFVLSACSFLPGVGWFFAMAMFLPLVPVRDAVAKLNRRMATDSNPNDHFSEANWGWILFGGVVVLYLFASAILGEPVSE